ncbi:class I SAM-dependent methyltransferase [Roseateles cellulosilyticus]|uniref:Class I SAM-dependent methyltransferase n=1 Tax=Pelomonas cellulosilytica TaxID=2906762 RepID=A0ABS8XST3_9BURK|nr:class I SAM-dependent methyltransferase [Pelomonas sp. P8]MCE4553783.1 class I SAM-dependent methyltransferase [Pelomonas sp. P8]
MPVSPLPWLRRHAWRLSPLGLLDAWADRRFDARHGTETSTDAQLRDLSIDSPNRRQAHRYTPTPPSALRRVLERLPIDRTGYSFVDIGSGKGRTLLVAAGLGFQRAVGVEFARELHRVAEANIAQFLNRAGGPAPGCAIESVLADATQYPLPAGDLVLYFFRPFHGGVLRDVLANALRHARHRRGRVWVVFLYLEDQRAVFDELGGFSHRFSWRRFDVFEALAA